MTPLPLSLALPYVALAATLLLAGLGLRWGLRHAGLAKRPVLLVTAALGLLPLLYVELVWMRALAERYVRFDRPALTLFCAAASAFVALRLLRLPSRTHPLRRLLTELLIGASTLIASLAVVGVELGRPLDKLTVIVAVDRSRSIDLVPGADARVRAELDVVERAMRENDRIGLVAFAADARTEDPPRPRSDNRSAQRVELGRDASDLAAGIRRSLAELPADSAARIVLLTDGVATRGDTLGATAAAVAAEVPIDVVPLDQREVPDVRLVALRMPPRADEREPIELRVVTSSQVPTEIELRITRDGLPYKKAQAKIQAGEDVLRIKELAPEPGLHRYDVDITALDANVDQAPEDNSASAFVKVRGLAQALIIEGEAGKATLLQAALTEAAFRVDVVSGSQVPADVAGLIGYDVVVFSDVRASDLSPVQIDALASYTRDLGGGLLLMGGAHALGPGGYARTPIEEVSPVSFDLKQERKRASLAEVISIDYSGSMGMSVGKYTKLDLANEAAARSLSLLGGNDRIGVAHVDTVNTWTIPLGPITDPAAMGSKIKAVGTGGGGIYVDLALDEAYKALRKEQANLKHLLLFSDGDDAEQLPGCRARVTTALSQGITTSVVALGKGSDVPELEALSKLGGGRFYLIEDATRLPAVFTQETVLASRSAFNEIDFRVSLGTSGAATQGIDFATSPILRGYVVTIPKSRATVHLQGPEGDPILATWSVGLGRSAAFTSDLKDRWGVNWTSWSGASRMIGQLARDIARKADDPRVRLESDAAGGELHVRATVLGDDGRVQSFRRLQARVAGPDGFAHAVPLEPIGAGAYATTVPLSRPGTYVATAVDELSGEVVGSTGAVLTAGEELRPTGTDRVLLTRLATMTGGKTRAGLSDVFLDRPPRRFSYETLTPLLAALAACAMLASVASRKLATPDVVIDWLERRKRRATRPVHTEATERSPVATAAALLDAKLNAQRAAPIAKDLSSLQQPSSPRPAPIAAQPLPAQRSSSAQRESSADAPTAAPRQQTAAEILLARRRGRRDAP